MKLLSYAAAAAISVLAAAGAQARDLDKGDAERQQILDAARQGEAVKFVVLDLYKDGDAAYLCALKSENGAIEFTDESPDVYRWGLRKQAGHWRVTELPSGPTEHTSPTAADCQVCDRDIASRDDIAHAIAHADSH
jgi:hypothetical protein